MTALPPPKFDMQQDDFLLLIGCAAIVCFWVFFTVYRQ